jgi:hypothetical protein
MKKILNLEEIANSEKNKWNYLLKSKNKDDLLYHTILNINLKGKILQKLFVVKINNEYKEILVWDMTISELLPSLFWIDYEWFFRDFGKVNTSDMCLRILEDSVEIINKKKEKYNNFLKKYSREYLKILIQDKDLEKIKDDLLSYEGLDDCEFNNISLKSKELWLLKVKEFIYFFEDKTLQNDLLRKVEEIYETFLRDK